MSKFKKLKEKLENNKRLITDISEDLAIGTFAIATTAIMMPMFKEKSPEPPKQVNNNFVKAKVKHQRLIHSRIIPHDKSISKR